MLDAKAVAKYRDDWHGAEQKAPVRSLEKELGELTRLVDANSDEQVAQIDARNASSRTGLIVLLVVAAAVLGLLLQANIKSIASSLRRAVAAAERIGRGGQGDQGADHAQHRER